MSRRRSNRRGFTLLETLVALALTAVVLAALTGTVGRTARGHDVATQAANRNARLRGVLLRLANELEAADPGQRLAFDRRGALSFGTFGRADGEPLLVAYDIDPATATLVRRQSPARGRIERETGQALLASVTAFHVRALDHDGWHDEWTADTLPRAVELTFDVTPDDITLHVTLPAAR